MQAPQPDDNTPLLAPQDVSRDTLYIVAWIDRKIDGVYKRIQDVTTVLDDRVTSLETSLAGCQATHKTEVLASAAEHTRDISRRDRIEKYAVPIIVAAVTSLGAFVLGRITQRW